jgi:hypothetical protein
VVAERRQDSDAADHAGTRDEIGVEGRPGSRPGNGGPSGE